LFRATSSIDQLSAIGEKFHTLTNALFYRLSLPLNEDRKNGKSNTQRGPAKGLLEWWVPDFPNPILA